MILKFIHLAIVRQMEPSMPSALRGNLYILNGIINIHCYCHYLDNCMLGSGPRQNQIKDYVVALFSYATFIAKANWCSYFLYLQNVIIHTCIIYVYNIIVFMVLEMLTISSSFPLQMTKNWLHTKIKGFLDQCKRKNKNYHHRKL